MMSTVLCGPRVRAAMASPPGDRSSSFPSMAARAHSLRAALQRNQGRSQPSSGMGGDQNFGNPGRAATPQQASAPRGQQMGHTAGGASSRGKSMTPHAERSPSPAPLPIEAAPSIFDAYWLEKIPDLDAVGDVFVEEKGWQGLQQQFVAEVHRAEFDDDTEMLEYMGQKKERLETLLPGIGPLVLLQPLLLALDTNVVAQRLVAMQGVLVPRGADVARLVMSHPSILLSRDPVELVTTRIAALDSELAGAASIGPLLARVPALLCHPNVTEDLAQVRRRHPEENIVELAAAQPEKVAAWISNIWV